ncbi:MAG: hypothetical protein ABI690_33135 [Chloroflexota bacterium]
MDIKTWSKDQTKNRDDEPADFPPSVGWQSQPPNRFQRGATIFFRILLAWIGLEVSGLRYAIGLNREALLIGAIITLLIVCLRYLHLPIRVGIAALFHRIIPEEDAAVATTTLTLDLEDQPDLDDEAYSQASVGDDGELVFNYDPAAKPKRDEL